MKVLYKGLKIDLKRKYIIDYLILKSSEMKGEVHR